MQVRTVDITAEIQTGYLPASSERSYCFDHLGEFTWKLSLEDF